MCIWKFTFAGLAFSLCFVFPFILAPLFLVSICLFFDILSSSLQLLLNAGQWGFVDRLSFLGKKPSCWSQCE